MKRLAAASLVAVAVIAIVSGCGSSSGNSSTSSGVSLPGGPGSSSNIGPAYFKAYYTEIIEAGATERVARCYQKHLEAMPTGEIEELLAPGEISAVANEKLHDFNASTEAACVGKGGAYDQNASPEQQKKTTEALATSLQNTLEAEGVSEDVINCLAEKVEGEPYEVLVEVTKHEKKGVEAYAELGEECGYSK